MRLGTARVDDVVEGWRAARAPKAVPEQVEQPTAERTARWWHRFTRRR